MLFENFNPILETIILSIGPLGAILAARNGYRAWLKYEIVVSSLFGIVLLFKPDSMLLPLLNSTEFTNYHWFLANLHGVFLIWSPFYAFTFLNSKDESIFYGHFWSRLVCHALTFIDNIYVYSLHTHWNYRILIVSAVFCVLEVVVNFYYIFTTKQPKRPSSSEFETVDYVARLDALILYDLQQSNESYRSICRASGGFLLSMSFESFCAVDFKFSSDKKNLMKSRLIGNLLELCVILSGGIFGLIGFKSFFVYLCGNLFYEAILFYGYNSVKEEPESKSE
ncbi:hypothetical protein BpHYR1_028043 [Brachionus plicatilis]|uniref:Uncharacterized protein n=1 Tax=Brachionus plicatilis TaxID=10195 RepID=A0A3M7SBG7_BRAPC|nr:hypothetical protein BpHYR1_028043 [Brachionus plicatilis]